MLDEFCNSLSNSAQLEIAIKLCSINIDTWEKYFTELPEKLQELNEIKKKNKIPGSYNEIEIDFLKKAIHKIENAYLNLNDNHQNLRKNLKNNPKLQPLLTTFCEPLMYLGWDGFLPYFVRLSFTSVWNILTWICFKKFNDEKETHIYIAINQAADIMLNDKKISADEINKILSDFQNRTRDPKEDEEDNLLEEELLIESNKKQDINSAYLKIISPQPIEDTPTYEQAKEIVQQMKNEGKTFWDKWAEYYEGTCKYYSYDTETGKYLYTEIDVIVGSFFNKYYFTEEEMIESVMKLSLNDLRQNDFII